MYLVNGVFSVGVPPSARPRRGRKFHNETWDFVIVVVILIEKDNDKDQYYDFQNPSFIQDDKSLKLENSAEGGTPTKIDLMIQPYK